MRTFFQFFFLVAFFSNLHAQDSYDLGRKHFNENQFDSARYYINQSLGRNPLSSDYFLSGMIHEAEGKDLRAIADYEAAAKKDPSNLEAFFQKGLIYYNTAGTDQAIKDFTYVIENASNSSTKAVYFASDPSGSRGTFMTTLQSMIGKVYQYRGMAYQKSGQWSKALADFATSFEYETSADGYINRSQLLLKMDREEEAVMDLNTAIQLDSTNYQAWFNLALIDESTVIPNEIIEDEEFIPMLNLAGANAFERGDFSLAVEYHSKAIVANGKDDLAYLNRGKALLRLNQYGTARRDFIKVMQLNSEKHEAFYLIGNSFYYEKNYSDAVGFYEQYLSIDKSYENVWFNAAMAYFNLSERAKACDYLEKANQLGMSQAGEMLEKHCNSQ